MSVSEQYVKTLRKNGDVKTARRYEEGLYNSLGAIDFDVLDNLLAEVKRLKNELTLANDLLHDVVLGHNLRTKNRKMWTSVLLDGGGPPSGNLTMLHLHEWFLEQQGEEE